MTEEQKSLVGDVTLVEKAPHNLEVGEGTYPQQGGKFRESYNDPSDIPDNVITFVRSTG
jgi:hypothetical protein